ncbi:hypothetical protein A2Y99_02440 [Candidatus Gottesmanbacteria bacterium RBG_13_37_7]|uniref:SH3b domain-containing protein n=1 Tax=Candidatus Gottesmanbacteria bacterium RBG_13_37_7 TaxID=1798369 RepID=A0A1F5YJX9_9BACT|nr:MAG: hypothetical protein A2Y99_02440 [Candidatus Gottesmanbacteria bacterium RBG_13_37_7]
MNKRALIVIILLFIGLLFGGYRLYLSRHINNAGLEIISTPSSSFFLNDKLIGKTPYKDKFAQDEYVIKLIPNEEATNSSSWVGKVHLNPDVWTYIKRDLGPSELTSAGEIITMEKISGSETQLQVLSTPAGATVVLDGQEKDQTPLIIKEITPGEHDIALFSPGMVGRTVRVQITLGYKLIANFQLSLAGTSESPGENISGSPEAEQQTADAAYILIKDTPTGFLRVRSEPSTNASESGRVKPGEKYQLKEEKPGWYKIIYEANKEGWISGRYAEKTK